MVGEHAQICDSIINSVIRSDWSIHLDSLDTSYYVTWGSSAKAVTANQNDANFSLNSSNLRAFGHPLGRLDAKDLKQVITNGMLTYSKFELFYVFFAFICGRAYDMKILLVKSCLQ